MQEISLNILDIAQNSVKAGAKTVRITVEECSVADTLTVCIEDDGCGMTAEQVAQVSDPFFTSRTTRKVGLGIPFLKMAAEMTGGSITIRSAPGEGTAITAVFGLSHIDRMPLGDMAETVAALVQCNPQMDILYCHRRDDASFTMDTREFRAVLGEDIPLCTPEVAMYIRSWLAEGEASLL